MRMLIKGNIAFFVFFSVMTDVILNKYLFALPLNRQEKLWSMLRVDIGRSTMANWIQYAYKLYFKHIDGLMRKELLRESVLHADETPVQVMKEANRKNTAKSYMWLYATGAFAKHKIRLFRYASGRGMEYQVEFLKGFNGYLHTDGYSAYDNVVGATICMCWAHARRKFVDSLPKGLENASSTIAAQAIKKIDTLFRIERDCAEISVQERYIKRQDESKKS